jgi:DNA polymerase-3 subunit epsilon
MKYADQNIETKILTRVPTILEFHSDDEKPVGVTLKKIAIIDTETTGLDSSKDEIIELGFMIVEYDESGRMYRVLERFNQLNEPIQPISEVIHNVTGITNEELKGQRIDWEQVGLKLADVDLFIAHNAGFDRKFLERYSDVFVNKAWACSQTMVDYLKLFHCGKNNQEFLVWKVCDSYYDAHRAIDDTNALSLLLHTADENGVTVLKHILEESKKSACVIKAFRAPFDDKDNLKAMGCRWNADKRVWEINATSDTKDSVLAKMKEASPSCQPSIVEINAKDRFSIREGA